MTYLAYKIEIDGSLSNKEHLNNIDEVNVWLFKSAEKGFNNVKIIRCDDGKVNILTRNIDNIWVK